MKKLLTCCFLLLCSIVVPFAEETAEEIIKGKPSTVKIETIGTRAKMEIQRNGATMAELLVDQYSVLKENDHRTFLEIKSPANVKGTRFLMIAKDGVTDQRIYLPSLGKVRRILLHVVFYMCPSCCLSANTTYHYTKNHCRESSRCLPLPR